MPPSDWGHVDHKITREVLEQKSIDEDSICQALTFADQCLQADQHNENVKHNWYRARAVALDGASTCWNELGDTEGTIEFLQEFWSV